MSNPYKTPERRPRRGLRSPMPPKESIFPVQLFGCCCCQLLSTSLFRSQDQKEREPSSENKAGFCLTRGCQLFLVLSAQPSLQEGLKETTPPSTPKKVSYFWNLTSDLTRECQLSAAFTFPFPHNHPHRTTWRKPLQAHPERPIYFSWICFLRLFFFEALEMPGWQQRGAKEPAEFS